VTEPGRPRRAAFVDRDGTIIREHGYLADQARVELLPGAVEGLAALQSAGYALVIVTNQSGIARGCFGEAAYRQVEEEVVRRLAEQGVAILASYFCPHHPDFTGPCDCRKPATGMVERAAREHRLSLAGSAFLGDRLRDVEAARLLGGIGVLVRTGYGKREAARAGRDVVVVDDLAAAARAILDHAPPR
jgi:D-glycero-D-manno-heptose 1,7-bisphosphate phosphatase